MRLSEILSLVALGVFSQQFAMAATDFPLAELKASEGTLVVNHETANGTIICR